MITALVVAGLVAVACTALAVAACRPHTPCACGDHEWILELAPGRIYLRCAACAIETPGWVLYSEGAF